MPKRMTERGQSATYRQELGASGLRIIADIGPASNFLPSTQTTCLLYGENAVLQGQRFQGFCVAKFRGSFRMGTSRHAASVASLLAVRFARLEIYQP